MGHAMDVLTAKLNPRFFHWPSFIFYAFVAVFAVVSLARRLFSLSAELDPVTALLIGRGVVAVAGPIDGLRAVQAGTSRRRHCCRP